MLTQLIRFGDVTLREDLEALPRGESEKFVKYTIDVDDSTLFFFSKGIVEGLTNIDSNKEITLSVPEEIAWHTSNNRYLVKDIILYYKQVAFDLGRKFDERNQNNNSSKQISLWFQFYSPMFQQVKLCLRK